MTPWKISNAGEGAFAITAGNLVVGSIARHRRPGTNRPTWRVEVPQLDGRDIVYVGPYLYCLAFVKGVEEATARQ